MKPKTENFKYLELQRWYKKPTNLTLKKLISDEISKAKGVTLGKHVLYLGLSEFKRKFKSKKQLSFISFDDLLFDEELNINKKLPFEDKSHDSIILVHTLDYTKNSYELIREIDRIATDNAQIFLIGFNKTSLWGLAQPYMRQTIPWILNFHSLNNIHEWFKLLSYKPNYRQTFSFFPYIPEPVIKIAEKLCFLQRVLFKNFGGVYLCSFKKEVIPATPVKIKFKDRYVVTPFSKSTLNRIK